MTKSTMTSKCTSVMAHFQCLADAPVLCGVHCQMQHVQGYPGSHWMPPSGNYLLRIAPRWPPGQQQTKQRWKNGPTLLAILMAVAVRRYDTTHIARWRRSRALVKDTGRCHWASIVANSCNPSCICCFFLVFSSSTCRKRLQIDAKAPINN